jgi:hypothetical protein
MMKRKSYNRCRGGVNSAPMMIAYTPAATAHAVAVLPIMEEAEGMAALVSTAHILGNTHKLAKAPHTSSYREKIDLLTLLPVAWTDMHNHQSHTSYAKRPGKSTRLMSLRKRREAHAA